jgi:hypothetical protein
MGTVDRALATDLREQLQLRRAIETGTLHGRTARALAGIFSEVVTIELSEDLHAAASEALRPIAHIRALQGHSVDRLRDEADADTPTFYFLDGHWSGGKTAGEDDECPVLDELEAIGAGHPDDCFVIDDARLFMAPPPPPHRAAEWPTIDELFEALRRQHPEHVITVAADQVIAVPARARPALDEYEERLEKQSQSP